jgi:hypothetical protein
MTMKRPYLMKKKRKEKKRKENDPRIKKIEFKRENKQMKKRKKQYCFFGCVGETNLRVATTR